MISKVQIDYLNSILRLLTTFFLFLKKIKINFLCLNISTNIIYNLDYQIQTKHPTNIIPQIDITTALINLTSKKYIDKIYILFYFQVSLEIEFYANVISIFLIYIF